MFRRKIRRVVLLSEAVVHKKCLFLAHCFLGTDTSKRLVGPIRWIGVAHENRYLEFRLKYKPPNKCVNGRAGRIAIKVTDEQDRDRSNQANAVIFTAYTNCQPRSRQFYYFAFSTSKLPNRMYSACQRSSAKPLFCNWLKMASSRLFSAQTRETFQNNISRPASRKAPAAIRQICYEAYQMISCANGSKGFHEKVH